MCNEADSSVCGVKADTLPLPAKDSSEPCAETEKDLEEVIPDVPNAPII